MFDNWYAVQVKSGQEEEIARKCKILISKDCYQECFIPKYKHMRRFKGQWYTIEDVYLKVIFL